MDTLLRFSLALSRSRSLNLNLHESGSDITIQRPSEPNAAPPRPSPRTVSAVIKVVCEAGKANPSPPVGPALGAKGVNIMAFCKEYNAKTAQQSGEIIPAVITVFEDKSFTFILKTPPTSVLIKKAVGISKGAGVRGARGDIVGSINEDQLREIATKKLPDLNTNNVTTAMRVRQTMRRDGVRFFTTR